MSNSEVVSAINGIGVVLSKLLDRVVNVERAVAKVLSDQLKKKQGEPKKRQSVPLVVRVSVRMCTVIYTLQ